MDPQIGVVRNVGIAMPDGVVLRTDIYRPLAEGRYPTLLERTPYSKSNGRYVGGLVLNPIEAVERGYCVVVQDVRGRYASDGEWEPFVHEGIDGAATVDWIAEQSWSDGQVGVYGASYMGVTALQTLVRNPSALKAGVLYMTGSNYFRSWVYAGGPFELKFNAGWTVGLVMREAIIRGESADPAILAAARNPASLLGETPVADIHAFRDAAPFWKKWHNHSTYDDYWRSIDAAAAASQIEVPVLHVSGWYDHFLRGHLDLYRGLEESSKHQRMLIGPWDHGSFHAVAQTMSGEREFGPSAVNGVALMGKLSLDWFDEFLKGRPAEPSPNVRYFVMGENRWHDSEVWPPAAIPISLYLRADGKLSLDPADSEPPDSYTYDPLNPVPTRGGRGSGGPLGPAGVQDQSEMADREDVLCFTTAPLSVPVTVAGPVSVVLYACVSTPSSDLTAKLVDVQPDGYCAILADGITRVIEAELNGTQEIGIDLWAVAHRFDAGHRIRLEISGGNYPRYDRNPNTGAAAALTAAEDFQSSVHTVLHDAEHPSRLLVSASVEGSGVGPILAFEREDEGVPDAG